MCIVLKLFFCQMSDTLGKKFWSVQTIITFLKPWRPVLELVLYLLKIGHFVSEDLNNRSSLSVTISSTPLTLKKQTNKTKQNKTNNNKKETNKQQTYKQTNKRTNKNRSNRQIKCVTWEPTKNHTMSGCLFTLEAVTFSFRLRWSM